MPVIVISTVGQSIINNNRNLIQDEFERFKGLHDVDLQAIKDDASGFPGEDIYDSLLRQLNAHKDDTPKLNKLSAELNSLTRILADYAPNNSDRLYFIATETQDGVLAARILADFSMEYFERDTEIHIISGLQVEDGQRFQRDGVGNLVHRLYSLLHNAPAGTYDRIINPTGGFKGVVPYLTIVGMLEENVSLSYLYERSPELITLAGLPIKLDFDRVKDYLDVMQKLNDEQGLSEANLLQSLNWSGGDLSQHPLWVLLESQQIDDNTLYSLSGLGVIALNHIRRPKVQQVFLSKQAKAALDKQKNGSERRRNYRKILNEIRDPQLRDNNMHTYPNNAGAVVYKLGRKQERAFYVMDGDDVLVMELTHHINKTDYATVPQSRKDYAKFEQWSPDTE